MNKWDERNEEAVRNEWNDRENIGRDRADLAEDEVKERTSDWGDDAKRNLHHAGNVAEEKATEVKHSIKEGAQKAKHRLEETFD